MSPAKAVGRAASASDVYSLVDSIISKRVFLLLEHIGIENVLSPTTASLPLVASPTPVVLCCVGYLIVVGLGLLIVRWSKAPPRAADPFPLRALMILHNCFLFLLSSLMCVGLITEAVRNKYSIWNNHYNAAEVSMARFIYVFYISKIYEFGDTLIMLLKRNTRQVTVLHVYHHCTIPLIWWLLTYHSPGGDAYFSAAMNSSVHVVMYLYYLSAAVIGKDDRKKRKYLWWGRYLTIMQMTQFVVNMFQAMAFASSKHPRHLVSISNVLFYYMISLLLLFANFYMTKYHLRKRKIL